MKRLCWILGVVFLLLGTVACGKDEEKDSLTKVENTEEENDTDTEYNEMENDESVLQRYTFVGYEFAYPEGVELYSADYGKIFYQYENSVFVGAPGTAGIMLEIENIEDIPGVVEQYIYETLEGELRALFSIGMTEQVIRDSEIKVINDVEMLRVVGVFKNNKKNTEIDYVAYYFLYGAEENKPVYMIGVVQNEDGSIEDFVDSLAQEITKK